jgi:hypothetical protein
LWTIATGGCVVSSDGYEITITIGIGIGIVV